jgi:hypothetical protein
MEDSQRFERRHRMNRSEFIELHENSVTDMRTYFAQAEKMSAMLAECSEEPMTFRERFRLMSQGIVENDAHVDLPSFQESSDQCGSIGVWRLKLNQYSLLV